MELPIEISTDASGGNAMNLNIPITSATPTVTETEAEVLGPFFPMDPLLDTPQQLPVDCEHRYNMFRRDK